jgi:zinc/manganese transport system permease protein
MVISAVVSVFSVWAGLVAAAIFNLPPSFLIVTIACGVWLVVWIAGRLPSAYGPPSRVTA